MSTIVVRCWSRVRIGGSLRWWGCKAVSSGGGVWYVAEPGSLADTTAQEGAICGVCGRLLAEAQRKALARDARRVARNCAKGFGPAKPGEDPFAGFRERPHEDCDCEACRPWTT